MIIRIRHIRSVLLLFAGLLVIITVFVMFAKYEKKETYPTLTFAVDESLLGISVADTTLNMRMSFPQGWSRINAVIFSHIFEEADKRFQQAHEQGCLQYIFWQQTFGAACVVSRDDTVSLDSFLSTWAGIL